MKLPQRPTSSVLKVLLTKVLPVALTLTISVIGFIAGRDVWQRYSDSPWTRDAHIRADVLQIAPDVAGLITEVNVHDNQPVQRGDVLFQIDRSRYALALSQARAALAAQRVMLAQARREAKRSHGLSDLVAQETVEEGDLKVQQGEAMLASAQTAVQVAELNLERTTVRSPADGFLSDRAPHVGDYVSTGRSVMAMVDSSSVYVDGYFEETKLDHVHVGQKVRVQVMGEPTAIRGHVQSLAAAIEDRDRSVGSSLLPSVNPTFNWVRLAQRIPVRITLDEVPADQRLIIGRTATVSVLTEEDKRAAHPAATASSAGAAASSAASGTTNAAAGAVVRSASGVKS